ncbi:ABC transporter permease [Maribellus sediminis]|uniref:ABC transporter permease n=1 Tax=Maribellus sediminis TaxID=2696285 RepID=UPI001430FF8F|nr:FtsX-like permease family protein [Maribellus sediminis]
MIKHFFLNILRNIRHNLVFTAINLTNLIIGFAVFILFSVMISYEINYDKFNTNYDRIYRVQTKQEDSYPTNFCTYSPAAYRFHLMEDVPEVDKVLLMREVSGGAKGSGQFFTLPNGSQLYELNGYWSENSIFDIFSIGKQVTLEGRSFPVIGVVKDFHPYSVHNPIPTYVMFLNSNIISGSTLLSVRFNGDEQKARAIVTSELETIFPNDPFEFKDFSVAFYLDEAIPFWQSMKRMFLFFAVVTLLISTIGLFGLILFTIKRRTKEIGVRKVLGSSVSSVYWQLSTEVIGMLGFAVLVGCPAAVYIYKTMPGAYKEPLGISEFVVAIGLVAIIAFITISYHVLKVAVSNPVEALRYE